jgi:hypothetical protein
MTPEQSEELKKKLISQIVAKKWQSLSSDDLDMGYNLLSSEQKQSIATSISNSDRAALELIRSFMLEILTTQAGIAADNFINSSPSAALFVYEIL